VLGDYVEERAADWHDPRYSTLEGGYVNGFDSFFKPYAERYMAADAEDPLLHEPR
jgi:hypothetical protein